MFEWISRRGIVLAGLLPFIFGRSRPSFSDEVVISKDLKYDDGSWHYEGNFPKNLKRSAASTHIAMFAAWAVLNGLAGNDHESVEDPNLPLLKARQITPTQWFIASCDEKLIASDLSDDGNHFAVNYYTLDNAVRPGTYLFDYASTFPSVPSLYDVPDSWETFDMLAPMISERFASWRKNR